MIIYQNTVSGLLDDIADEHLVEKIKSGFKDKNINHSGAGEIRAWENSFKYIYLAFSRGDIPPNAGVAIEFVVQPSSKRADLMISGRDKSGNDHLIVIELKQWNGNSIEHIDGNDHEVKVQYENGMGTSKHPSFQAWSYANLLRDFNSEVQEHPINIHPVAYLHNCDPAHSDKLEIDLYEPYINNSPIFYNGQAQDFRRYIEGVIKTGDDGSILRTIANSDLKPRKSLQDGIHDLLNQNAELTLIEEQRKVLEDAIDWIRRFSSSNQKRVLIVEGEPGSGKTVVAVNLLVEYLQHDLSVQYVSKNDQPRKVFRKKLQQGGPSMVKVDSLFSGSGAYRNNKQNDFDALIIDEAHRLNEKSGFYGNKGENQVKEIINAAQYTVFFIDENQRIDTDDIGSESEIRKHANNMNAKVDKLTLRSQLRCTGSGDYVAWVDDLLEIEPKPPVREKSLGYDVELFEDPKDLHESIADKNEQEGLSRVVAGYCWDWDTDHQDDSDYADVQIGTYERSWNRREGDPFAIDEGSIDEVGCIHTCQGLEFEYVGVVIGPDLRLEEGDLITDFGEQSSQDTSWHGLGGMSKENPKKAESKGEEIIKNTYRTLLTRGMQGCYIYCCDDALQEYVQQRIAKIES
jgi:DUF2075 family protein